MLAHAVPVPIGAYDLTTVDGGFKTFSQHLGPEGKVRLSFKKHLAKDLPVLGFGGVAMGSNSALQRANNLRGHISDALVDPCPQQADVPPRQALIVGGVTNFPAARDRSWIGRLAALLPAETDDSQPVP